MALACLQPAFVLAQDTGIGGALGPSGDIGSAGNNLLNQTGFVVEGQVKDMAGNPVSGARVDVEPLNGGAGFQALATDALGRFSTEFWLNAEQTPQLRVLLVVNKKGFPKGHEIVRVNHGDKPFPIPVTLRDPHQDPSVLSGAELISTLAPKLKNLGPADGLSAKSAKDYARGVDDFLVRNHSNRALDAFTKAVDRNADCVQCRTMLALAELATGDWDSASRDLDQAVNDTLKDRATARPEPLVFYGVMESWRHNFDQAAAYAAEAIKHAPQDALALQELGRAELRLQNPGTAATYLAKAVAAGAGEDARLLHAEALLEAGDYASANSEMAHYLKGRDVKLMPLQVREVYLKIQDRKKVMATYAKVKPQMTKPVDYLRRTVPELQGLEPAASRAPLSAILDAVGKNVAAFFQNFPNTSSLEQVQEEKLSRKGKVVGEEQQRFYYLCVLPAEAWGPGFSEYRQAVSDLGAENALEQGYMLTAGFASASLVFHPLYQSQSTFRYLGRQKVNGKDMLVIAFAQNPEKSRLSGSFKFSGAVALTYSQGLAWIDPATYQIIRLRTDLLAPLPAVRLERETTDIDYAEVKFKSAPQGFWLPRTVSVTVDWNGRALRNQHQYSDFRVFGVSTASKISAPPAPNAVVTPDSPQSQQQPQP